MGGLGKPEIGLCGQDLTLHLAFMSLQSPLIYDSFQWYLLLLICISLMTDDAEHIFLFFIVIKNITQNLLS